VRAPSQTSASRTRLPGGRVIDPLKPAYSLPTFKMAEYGEPRSITESMATRANQWTLQKPEAHVRSPTDAHTLRYSDINERTFRQRFRATVHTRPLPPPADDITSAREYRAVPARGTNALTPAYIGLNGKVVPPVEPHVVAHGHRYPRAHGENFSLRTDDIDRCFADAYAKKYGAFAVRTSNRVEDIFGAQHDTVCREPQVWRASGPFVDPGNRHVPETLLSKRTNRVDDIAGAQAAKGRAPFPLRRHHDARAAELVAQREYGETKT